MSYIDLISDDDATGPTQRAFDAARTRAGGVANILRVMSRDGHALQGSMAHYTSVMKRPNALPPATRELLATVTSTVNDCYY